MTTIFLPSCLGDLASFDHVIFLGDGHSAKGEAMRYFKEMLKIDCAFHLCVLFEEEGKKVFKTCALDKYDCPARDIPTLFIIK